MIRACRFAALSLILLPFTQTPLLSGPLRPDDRAAMLQHVVPAYRSGDPLAVLSHLSAMRKTWSTEELLAADQLLKELGAPTATELLAQSRLQLVKQRRRAPKPGWQEAVDVGMAVIAIVDQREKQRTRHPAMQAPPIAPATFGEYRRFLEDLELLQLQLDDSRLRIGVARKPFAPLRNAKLLAKLDDAQRAAVRRDYKSLDSVLAELAATFDKVMLRLRVNQAVDAAEVIRLSEDPAERLMAAVVLDVDGPRVLLELRAPGGELGPAAASLVAEDAALPDRLADALKRTTLPRQLVDKARRLEEAVQWWLRGRYAVGPMGNGLLKLPGADRDLRPHLSLGMPVAPLRIDESLGDDQSPQQQYQPAFPRRHHYIWQNPDRDVQYVETSVDFGQTILRETVIAVQEKSFAICGTEITLERSIFQHEYLDTVMTQSTGYVVGNPRDVYQWVGFVEYGNYLRRMDPLMQEFSPHELQAVEEVVLGDSRLAFESNLSRHIEPTLGPLSERPAREGDTFGRHDLKWMTALARVEHAAMLAAYTDIAYPFAFVQPTKYEQEAYFELLLDGFRTHYLSLPADVWWQQLGGADSRLLLSLQRRLSLTAKFAAAIPLAKLTPIQRSVFAEQAARVQRLEAQVEQLLLFQMRPRTSNKVVGESVQSRLQPGATRVTHEPR